MTAEQHTTEDSPADDLVTWVMPREDARDLLRWLRHNRPLGMPDRTFSGLVDALTTRVTPPAQTTESDAPEAVGAFPRWGWDCPACQSPNTTEYAPPEDEECDVCGYKVRTDPR